MGFELETSPRTRALALMKERDALEAEMEAIASTLTAPGAPGLTGNLVDSEGFPRSDIDIPAVRTQRGKLARLRTDHKVITEKIEALLHEALAPAAPSGPVVEEVGEGAGSSSVSGSTSMPSRALDDREQSSTENRTSAEAVATAPAESESRPNPSTRPPFAKVDIVSPDSPASTAGLRVDDEIVTFGAVSLRTSPTPLSAMQALPGLLQSHENREVVVTVVRAPADGAGRETVELTLTPRRWSGNGLLGCHVIPMEVPEDPFVPEVATLAADRNAQGTGSNLGPSHYN